MDKKRATKKSIKVLLVEDTHLCRLIVERRLSSEGYEVFSAESGSEALAMIEDNSPPDVILLDLMMPGMDGEETLRRIRQMGNKSAIIIVSAAIDRERLVQLQSLGACGFITKPINFVRLGQEIQKALQSRKEA